MEYSKRHSIKKIIVAVLFLLTQSVSATDYTVTSADEFNALTLVAGDVVTWSDGTYVDQHVMWSGEQGTMDDPITLKAETPGGVIFTGSSKMNIYGSHLVIEGFYWKGGEGENNHIEFRKNGSSSEFAFSCTIRNCAFDDLFTEEPNKSRWIVLYGSSNTVENCSFVNKRSAGALILVELLYSQNITPGHLIQRNYFFNITPKDDFVANANDSETIRVGSSAYQNISAQVIVEGNYFQAADGENEIISNKSADNTFRYNTFRNCRGSLVLRHGSGAHIEGNYFLGEGKAKSGGIRVSDRDHVIINNYMQDLNNAGDIWNNAITLVGGGAASGGSSNGYQNVDNLTVAHNTVYNADDPIFFNDRNAYDPTGVIANNLIYSENGNLVSGDIEGTGQGIDYEGNIFGGSAIGISHAGITEGDAHFMANGETFRPSSSGIAADAGGSTYSDLVNIDVEGLVRPNSDLDVGAHEVSGASGNIQNKPLTDADVGVGVGACFIGAEGNSLAECGAVGDFLTATQLSDFEDDGEIKPVNITSNVSWTATVDRDWITINPMLGSGNGTIEVTVAAHTGTDERTGTVVLSGDGVTDEVIFIVQLGYEPPVAVTGVSLDPPNTLALGAKEALGIRIFPADATNKGVSFVSTDTDIVTVEESGLVTGVAAGLTTIKVTTADGGFTATTDVEVRGPSTDFNWALNQPVTGTGTPDGANVVSKLVDGDAESRWSVQGFPQSATLDLGGSIAVNQTEVISYNDRAYQFTIEGAQDENGMFFPLVDRTSNSTQGTASTPIIDAVDDVIARFVRVTVYGADVYEGEWVSLTEFRVFGNGEREVVSVEGVALGVTTFELMEGQTQQLTVSVTPLNATDLTVSFSTSDANIATVSADGLVTAKSQGRAVVTVVTTDGNYMASADISVTRPLNVRDKTSQQVWLTPNPTKGIVIINGEVDYYRILLYDQAGKMQLQRTRNAHNSLDVSRLRPGMYYVKLEGESSSEIVKLIRR